jgi:hypothetical protein
VHLAHYLGLLHKTQADLAAAFREVGDAHREEVDVFVLCKKLAAECDRHAERVGPFADRYREDAPSEPDRLHSELFRGTRSGGLGLLRDLHDLYLMATECDIAWTLVGQAAHGARDGELLEVVKNVRGRDRDAAQVAQDAHEGGGAAGAGGGRVNDAVRISLRRSRTRCRTGSVSGSSPSPPRPEGRATRSACSS